MEGVTQTKFGAKMKGWTIQRLPHKGIHSIISHQTQTLGRCQQEPVDRSLIWLSPEALPVPDKYRSGGLQPSIGQSTRSPMKELEKIPQELKGTEAP